MTDKHNDSTPKTSLLGILWRVGLGGIGALGIIVATAIVYAVVTPIEEVEYREAGHTSAQTSPDMLTLEEDIHLTLSDIQVSEWIDLDVSEFVRVEDIERGVRITRTNNSVDMRRFAQVLGDHGYLFTFITEEWIVVSARQKR